MLVAPNQDLCDAAQRLHQQATITFRHGGVLLQNAVQVLKVLQRQAVFGPPTPGSAKPAATPEHVGN